MNEEPIKEFRDLVRKLDNLSYEFLDHEKIEGLIALIEDFQKWGCEAYGHNWAFDQCGYWQHQFCIECMEAKYPDMAGQRCGELIETMGNMTESEYLQVANFLDLQELASEVSKESAAWPKDIGRF